MGILEIYKVERIHHCAPLHYLPFICTSNALLSKPSLRRAGFHLSHFRSTSSRHDVARGFGNFVHLTLASYSKILEARLAAGFPHIDLAIPADSVETAGYSLCRFNVAMTRFLRRNGKSGFPESPSNGRYYGEQHVPTARTNADKKAMLQEHLHSGTIIEVLINRALVLPRDRVVVCFDEADSELAQRIVKRIGLPWSIVTEEPPGRYPRNSAYAGAVEKFVERALADPAWRGDGLEFDKV